METEKFQEFMVDQFAKLFKEFQGFKTDVTTEFTGVNSELSTLKSELSVVKQSQARMETEFGSKLDALYIDWRETQKQFNNEIKVDIKNLGTKVEALQMESTKHDQEIKDITESKFYLVKAPKE